MRKFKSGFSAKTDLLKPINASPLLEMRNSVIYFSGSNKQ